MKTRTRLILAAGLLLASALDFYISAPASLIAAPAAAQSAIPDESGTVRLVAAENAGLMARLRTAAATCSSEADPSCATVSVLKGEMTRRIAWAIFQHDHRWGLRKKSTGTHATRPSDGEQHSTDVVMWKDDGKIVDVMSDRDAGWSSNPGDFQPLDQWLQPQPEGTGPGTGTVTPPPPPPPSPPPTPASDGATADLQQQQLAALVQLIQVQQQQLDALAAQNAAIVKGLADLKAAIAAGVKIRF